MLISVCAAKNAHLSFFNTFVKMDISTTVYPSWLISNTLCIKRCQKLACLQNNYTWYVIDINELSLPWEVLCCWHLWLLWHFIVHISVMICSCMYSMLLYKCNLLHNCFFFKLLLNTVWYWLNEAKWMFIV